jgi:hypothetical protein
MAVGSLLCSLDPSWNVRDVMIAGDESELQGISCFKAE